jgi:Tol biopolymer transport system component
MVLLALVVNRYLAMHQSILTSSPGQDPTAVHAQVQLPGTIILAQSGALYKLQGSSFTQITPHDGWTQPSPLPDGSGVLAVQRGAQWSDIYELGFNGSVKQQLTNNKAAIQDASHIADNNWAFYPEVGNDGRIYYDYDEPKSGYEVDMAIWSSPLGPITADNSRQETTPNGYSGGDAMPVPIGSGSLIFVKYSVSGNGTHYSQIWWQQDTTDPGHAMTQDAEQCTQPSLSPDGTHLAMICNPSEQEADVVVATVDPETGTLGSFHRLVTGELAGAPAWSPDSKSLIYFSPNPVTGDYQLSWIDGVTTSKPAQPELVTDSVDFDATSAPMWLSSTS